MTTTVSLERTVMVEHTWPIGCPAGAVLLGAGHKQSIHLGASGLNLDRLRLTGATLLRAPLCQRRASDSTAAGDLSRIIHNS